MANDLAIRNALSKAHLPDNNQWTNRFEIRSESSNRVYIIAQNIAKRHWACSCPSFLTRRYCKHLSSLGLPVLEQPYEVKELDDARKNK